MRRAGDIVRLFNAQAGLCVYCGRNMAIEYGKGVSVTRDHVVPRARGGEDHPDNIVGACYDCNQQKGQKSLVIFLLNRVKKAPARKRAGVLV